jgi:uncharacterized peroxidase-related enzyme
MKGPFLSSVPGDKTLLEVVDMLTLGAGPGLRSLIESVMEGNDELTRPYKEMLAAYISTLNCANYCMAHHTNAAKEWGVEPRIVDALGGAIEAIPIDEKFKPLLALVKKLNNAPATVGQDDIDAALAAGWSEKSVNDAILVCARFNMMNRITLAHGLSHALERAAEAAE